MAPAPLFTVRSRQRRDSWRSARRVPAPDVPTRIATLDARIGSLVLARGVFTHRSRTRVYEDADTRYASARPAVRAAVVCQGADVHPARGHDARARDRGLDRDLLDRERHPPAVTPLSRGRSTRLDERSGSAGTQRIALVAGFSRLARAAAFVRGHGRIARRLVHAHRTRPGLACDCADDHIQLLPRDWRAAGARTHLHRGGRRGGRAGCRDRQSRLLAHAARRRRVSTRTRADAERTPLYR